MSANHGLPEASCCAFMKYNLLLSGTVMELVRMLHICVDFSKSDRNDFCQSDEMT